MVSSNGHWVVQSETQRPMFDLVDIIFIDRGYFESFTCCYFSTERDRVLLMNWCEVQRIESSFDLDSIHWSEKIYWLPSSTWLTLTVVLLILLKYKPVFEGLMDHWVCLLWDQKPKVDAGWSNFSTPRPYLVCDLLTAYYFFHWSWLCSVYDQLWSSILEKFFQSQFCPPVL